MKNNAVDTVVETVTEKANWFTPKRLLITAAVALAAVGTVVLVRKVAGAVEENEEYLENAHEDEVPVAKKAHATKSAA
jgi:hypothetical protein